MTTMTVDTRTDELRQKTVQIARSHRASWIELGQMLYSIYKDKHYRSWGFLSFETYCKKELTLKQTTAVKLLKSYSFLEREEPRLADRNFSDDDTPKRVPEYESVNLLRLAKENKQLTPQDFSEVRDSVINNAVEPKEVRAQIKKLIEEKNPLTAAEEKKNRRNSALRRVVSTLSIAKTQLASERLLPDFLLKQMGDLISKLQDQIES
ncbi:MAG: hypothetical protein Q8R76_07585 [Candidatus Omnitrophota bacterium]|nr:hypothetical protein [Candidatus Omnitrophota bacterium]